jgi:tetratricopeptide (TPR) repeat protein
MAKLGLIREKSGHLSVALRWFRRGLNLVAASAAAGESKVELSLAYGGVRFRQGRFHDTIKWCESALDEPAMTDAQRAHALSLLVTAYAHIGSPLAVEAGREAIEIYEQIGDLVGTGNVLNNLGVHAYYRGDWDEARNLWSRSEAARRKSGDLIGAAASVNNLAEIYSDQGRLDEAEEGFRRALYEWNSGGIKTGVALAHVNLGRALTRRGVFEEAAECLDEGLSLFEEIGAQSYVFESQIRKAELLLFAGRFQDASKLASHVLSQLGRDESTLMQRAALRRVRGYCEAARGNKGLVERELHASLRLATQANAEFEMALTLEALTRLLPDDPERERWNDDQAGRLKRLGVIATPVIPLG